MVRASGFLFFACLALLFLVACEGVSESAVPSARPHLVEYSKPSADAPKLAHWGAYPVGVRSLTFIEEDRLALLDIDPETGGPRSGDRTFKSLVWYPAIVEAGGQADAVYERQFIQDPKWPMPDFPRTWQTSGHAVRDAAPVNDERFPLVVIAHGWAGNPGAFAYLGENLASKGYVVIAPDLVDVLPEDPQVFELLFPRAMINRALDLKFILGVGVGGANDLPSWLSDLIDREQVALIGNSLGGMGALRVAGAAYDGTSPAASWIPGGLFENQTGQSDQPIDVTVDELDALILIAPWGAQDGVELFPPEALETLDLPLLVFAGELDAIAGYATGPQRIYEQAGSDEKFLLTFESAGHGIAPAPVPASARDYAYGAIGTRDPVWRSEAIAATQQHFLTAFLDAKLKGDLVAMRHLLVKTGRAADGVWPLGENETPDAFAPVDQETVTYWPGFRRHRARGLQLDYETRTTASVE